MKSGPSVQPENNSAINAPAIAAVLILGLLTDALNGKRLTIFFMPSLPLNSLKISQ